LQKDIRRYRKKFHQQQSGRYFWLGGGAYITGKERKGREGKGREGKGREGKGKEGKGREGKGREGKGREGKGREGKGREGKGRERVVGKEKGRHLIVQSKMRTLRVIFVWTFLKGERRGRLELNIFFIFKPEWVERKNSCTRTKVLTTSA
jgi:hypothetical protein